MRALVLILSVALMNQFAVADTAFSCRAQNGKSVQLIYNQNNEVKLCNTTAGYELRLLGGILRKNQNSSSGIIPGTTVFKGANFFAPIELRTNAQSKGIEVLWSIAACAGCQSETAYTVQYECNQIPLENASRCEYFDIQNDGESVRPNNMAIYNFMLKDVRDYSGDFNAHVSLVSKDGSKFLAIGFFGSGLSYYGSEGMGGGNDINDALRFIKQVMKDGDIFKQGSNNRGLCLLNEILTRGQFDKKSPCYQEPVWSTSDAQLLSCQKIL
jgi:hypothetical protein